MVFLKKEKRKKKPITKGKKEITYSFDFLPGKGGSKATLGQEKETQSGRKEMFT